MATYDELRTQFTSILNRRDITTTLRDSFLQDAIRRAQRLVRTPALDRSIQVTINTETELSIPIDLLKLINLSTSEGRIRMVDIDTVLKAIDGGETGVPRIAARRDAKWALAPIPQTGQEIRIDYTAEDDVLSAGSDESNLSITAPDLIIYGALSYACDYYQDKRVERFEQRFQQIVAEVNDASQDDELSGGAQVSAAYSFEDDF